MVLFPEMVFNMIDLHLKLLLYTYYMQCLSAKKDVPMKKLKKKRCNLTSKTDRGDLDVCRWQ